MRLMERFDLSYQIEADQHDNCPTHSLIPQLLPHSPPLDLSLWREDPLEGQAQVEMIYRLSFVPAGLMSWFIVRTHRYTEDLHWREGAILEYEGHRALVVLNPILREIRLVVRGLLPHNFFTILRNTLDLILARFEGLNIQRDMPCICHRHEVYRSAVCISSVSRSCSTGCKLSVLQWNATYHMRKCRYEPCFSAFTKARTIKS